MHFAVLIKVITGYCLVVGWASKRFSKQGVHVGPATGRINDELQEYVG